MNDGPEWFAPKRYGYGASLPISWQGWVLTFAFVGIIMLAGVLLKSRPWQLIAVAIPVSVTFMVICAKTTRGGWRWRWGEED
jgi:hypothetical protein